MDTTTFILSVILMFAISFALNHIAEGNFFMLFDWLLITCSMFVYAEMIPFFMFILFLIIDATISIYSIFSDKPNTEANIT